MSGFTYNDELCHHGIKGQKWGVRRYQNPDGTLTEVGKKRYMNSNGTYDKYNVLIDATQRSQLSSKQRAAKSIMKREVNKNFKGDKNLNSITKKFTSQTEKAVKMVDKFLQKKLDVQYAKQSVNNQTHVLASMIVQDIIRDNKKRNRKTADSQDQLRKLTVKDHLKTAAIGAFAGPGAASAYTASRLARD